MIPNYDEATKMHYGVISQNAIVQAWSEDAEPVYNERQCKCDEGECECEPEGYKIDTPEYTAIDCLDNDVMIIKSPFFTYCRPCSPCCPNAGDLGTPTEEDGGIPAYCFGPKFYYPEEMPSFSIYSVETKEKIYTPEPAAV